MDEHYLFLSSDLSKDQYPSNEPGDFTIELPHPYDLSGSQWLCGLKEIQISITEDVVYVCSDICAESYAENTMVPVLRALQKSKGKNKLTYFSFENPMYVRIKPTVLNRVRLFIRGSRLERVNVKDSIVRCTLHFKKWK